MQLLIDIGNTCAKLVIAHEDDFIHFERLAEPWDKAFARLTSEYDITQCVISNVGHQDELLQQSLAKQPFPTTWLTFQTPNPVLPECVAPYGLGADRWAADIGAMGRVMGHESWVMGHESRGMGHESNQDREAAPFGGRGALLVIDAGTCITYDLMSLDGKFIGGNISPGVQLRLKAMHEHTALLPLLNAEDGPAPLFGTDTDTAMRAGAVTGAKMEMEGFIREAGKKYSPLYVFTTGGNHFEMNDDLPAIVTHDPMLLFRGLKYVADNL